MGEKEAVSMEFASLSSTTTAARYFFNFVSFYCFYYHTHTFSLSLSVSSIQKQSLVKTLRVLFMPTHVKHS